MSHVGRYLDPNLLQRLNQLQLSARSVVEGSTAGTHRSRVRLVRDSAKMVAGVVALRRRRRELLAAVEGRTGESVS